MLWSWSRSHALLAACSRPVRPCLLLVQNELARASASHARALHATAPRLLSDARPAGWPSETEDDIKRRRQWLEAFEPLALSSTDGPAHTSLSVSYARSSGAGGQHVNTTSSKAVVKLDLASAVGKGLARIAGAQDGGVPGGAQDGWLLPSVSRRLRTHSPYYVSATHSLLLTSSRSRSAPQNLADALRKLHEHIRSVAAADLPGETSAEQRARVRRLQAQDKARTRASKERRGETKKGRGKVSL